MKILNDVKNFSIRGVGIIEVDSFGNIVVNGKELRESVVDAFGFQETLYDSGIFSGTLTLSFEPDMIDELAIVREDGMF